MSTYTHFAVLGAREIGNPLIAALAAIKDVSVVVLTRASSSSKVKLVPGVTSVEVDYTDRAQIVAALKAHKVQVVLSTVGSTGIEAQFLVADAAKEAGVQLFSPSEYGNSTVKSDLGILATKRRVAEHLAEIGLPSLRVFTGLFSEYIPWLVGYDVNKKFNLVGEGNGRVGVTAISDIAGFVAYVVTTLPPAKLANQIFRIQGEAVTLEAVAAAFNVETVQVDAVPAVGENGPAIAEFQTALQKIVYSEGLSVLSDLPEESPERVLSNALWEGHEWKSVKDVLKL